jgi:hypothetical protein
MKKAVLVLVLVLVLTLEVPVPRSAYAVRPAKTPEAEP